MPVTVDKVTFNINRKQILQTMGYNSGPTAPTRILKMVNELARQNLDFTDPSYSYIIRDIQSVQDDRINIEGSIRLRSRTLARMLKTCRKVAMFVLTIGDRLEQSAATLAREGSVLKASVLEAIGSNAVEQVAELLHDRISYEVSNRGLLTGRRFSPGYCDWAIDQQEIVFQAMNGNSAGVQLTEGYLMLPRKSISGLIGIGTPDSGITNYNPCLSCLKADCPGRRG